MKANEVVENLFRHESGHIISRLSVRYGMTQLAEIEDAVSEAMMRAIKTWNREVPDSPTAWLYRVSSRILIDGLRRKQLYYERVAPEYKISSVNNDEKEDHYTALKLMLWCAHPELPAKDQLGLMLQLISGFSIKEISSALLIKPEALKKRLQRARLKLKSIETELVLPEINDVQSRFSVLRSAIYLGFNEGYYSINHDSFIREDLIFESLRLTKLLCDAPHDDSGTSQALMSLLLYHTSRVPARRTDDNSFILLEDQDRRLWDQPMINIANQYLQQAMSSEYYTQYHTEAVIASIHTQTKDYKLTNWSLVAQLYGQLDTVSHNPIIRLNQAYAILKSGQIDEAFLILKTMNSDEFGVHRYLYFGVCSEYYSRIDDPSTAREVLWQAVDSAPNESIRRVLVGRLSKIGQ